jgi:putative transposase
MRKKRFTVEQMIGVQKQAQVGAPVAEVIRKAGISEQTFYRWQAKYAGLEVDEVVKMAQLQEENLRLKQLVGEVPLLMGTLFFDSMRAMTSRRVVRLEM